MQRPRARGGHTDLSAEEEQLPVLAEEPTDVAATTELIRRETRGARIVATVALVLAAVATLCMLVVVFRVQHGLTQVSARSSVGLDTVEVGAAFDQEDASADIQGWYRTYLNTLVRESPDLESKRVGVLAVGKEVYVVEKRGRRVRIETPLAGWMSMETTDGVKILRRDLSQLGNSFNRSALNKAFQSKQVLAMHDSMQNTAAKFTQLEQRLIDTLKLMNERIVTGGDHPLEKATQAVGKTITSAAQEVQNQAVDVAKNSVQAANARSKDIEAILNNKLKVQVPHNFNKFLG